MKRKAISIAVASACIASGSAMAFDPDVTSPDYEVVMAGATAPTNTLRDVIVDNVCDSSIDYYQHKSNKHWNIACVVDGDNVLFRKNDGGSGTGTSPVDNASTTVEFFDGGQSVVDCSSSAASTGNTAYTAWKDCGNSAGAGGEGLTTLVADIGVSDVEPGAFTGALAPLSDPLDINTNVDFVNESSMDVRTLAGLGFGVVVTEQLYRALQNDQFKSGHPLYDLCNPTRTIAAGGSYDAAASDAVPAGGSHTNGDTEMCLPNMASHTIRSIFRGDLNLWTEMVTDTDGDGSAGEPGESLFVQEFTGANPWKTTNVNAKVCRRVQGSGTHARTAITFLRTNCGSGSITMGNPTCNTKVDGADCNNGFEGAQGSGEMTDCLNAASGNDKWAVGYHSVEKNAELSHPFRFVKVDGFAPTIENMVSGNYANFGEVTMQKRVTQTGAAALAGVDFVHAPSNATEVNTIFETMVTAMSGPAAAEALNTSSKFYHPFGNAGWAARPNPPSVVPFPQTLVGGIYEDPVNPLTHVNPATGVQNTCFGPYAPAGSQVD